jgi:BirA family biotin operon repressor/biotin-[acetyl-CoA-carboxylase] ligase
MKDEQKRIDLDSSFIVHPSSFPKRILEFDTVVSTNTVALELANDPANHGVVIVAREQTGGRGQYGRSWLAPAGSSVLLSILLFPPPALRRPSVLTAWAAVSVCELCQQLTGVPARIKWPNDVLIQGRKVCGILIEQRAAGADSFASVVGIGLNVTQSAVDFATAGLMEAASLAVYSERAFDARQISDELLRRLDQEYLRLGEGDLDSLERRWKTHLGLLDKQVTAECIKETLQGRLLDVSFARLELEVNGKKVCLPPEAVRQVEKIG